MSVKALGTSKSSMQYYEQDVIALVSQQHSQAARRALRGLIIQPGAIGDCILTLPLASYIQQGLGLGGVDILGHMEYLSIFPGRTCIDAIKSIDLLEMYRLFEDHTRFDLADRDPLITAFAEYTWIVSFLGEPGSSFEKNLTYTAMCSHSAEVICLPFRPPAGLRRHVTEFYISQFRSHCPVAIKARPVRRDSIIIRPTSSDKARGKGILLAAGISQDRPVVAIHPGSGAIRKCWHIDNFLAVARALTSRGIQPVFIIGPAEQERLGPSLPGRISSYGPVLEGLSLEDVLAVISLCRAFIGNDTGISHMAGGMGVNTFVLFGPTDPVQYRPIGPCVKVIKARGDGFNQRPSVKLQARLLDHITSLLLPLGNSR